MLSNEDTGVSLLLTLLFDGVLLHAPIDKVISKLSSNLITKGEMFSIIARNSIISVEDFQRQICLFLYSHAVFFFFRCNYP